MDRITGKSLHVKVTRLTVKMRTLSIRALPSKKDNSWVEYDDLMFHACFSILELYVEKSFGSRDEYAKYIIDVQKGEFPELSEVESNLLKLYDWYQEVKISTNWCVSLSESDTTDKDSQEKLMELISLRNSLWI